MAMTVDQVVEEQVMEVHLLVVLVQQTKDLQEVQVSEGAMVVVEEVQAKLGILMVMDKVVMGKLQQFLVLQ